MREQAVHELEKLVGIPALDGGVSVKLENAEVLFAQVRILRFQAYLAATWSIYDTVTAVAGNLASVDEIQQNPRNNLNFVNNIVNYRTKPNAIGGWIGRVLNSHFAWPISFSYAVRNRLLHHGGEIDGVGLFASGDVGSGFSPSHSAMNQLENVCENRYQASKGRTRRREAWPWKPDSLLETLVLCHDEADEAVGILILWAVEAMRVQVELVLGGLVKGSLGVPKSKSSPKTK